MALKSAIYKVTLQVNDLDRHYYQSHSLTIAKHPSETEERMMIRILAFALNADENLQFCRGLSTDDEPDLWRKDLIDHIELWIEVGQPDVRRIRKGCLKADQMLIYSYGETVASPWWKQTQKEAKGFKNLSVFFIPDSYAAELTAMVERTMVLDCTISEGSILISNGKESLQMELECWQPNSHQ